MASEGINVENLPTHILEEIFMFVSNRKSLRLVSKTFKEVVDNYPKLMQKYVLNISYITEYSLYPPHTTSYHQAFKFNNSCLSLNQFKWMNCYQHKEKIKFIELEPFGDEDDEPEKFVIFLQSILFNFTSIRELYLDLSSFFIEREFNPEMTLISSDLSNLEVLTITCGEENDISGVINLFWSVQNIKSFNVECAYDFPFSESVWKLEELSLRYFCDCHGLEDCMKFLLRHKDSLKILRHDNHKLCHFAIKNLPNLEVLHMDIHSDDPFFNDSMISNDKLRCLTVIDFDGDVERLENTLSYYDNIECLMIMMPGDDQKILGPIFGIELSNLTQLWLDGLLSNFFLNIKMPNLKFLEISNSKTDDPYNFWRVPAENLMNLEKLSIKYVWRMKEICQLISMCPKLFHLNLGHFKEFENFHPGLINTMLAHTHQIRYLGLLESNQNIKREELLSQIHKKNIVVKFYNDFRSMMKEYWKMGSLGSERYGMLTLP